MSVFNVSILIFGLYLLIASAIQVDNIRKLKNKGCGDSETDTANNVSIINLIISIIMIVWAGWQLIPHQHRSAISSKLGF